MKRRNIIIVAVAVVVAVVAGILLSSWRFESPSPPLPEKKEFFALGLSNRGVAFIDLSDFAELNYTMEKSLPSAIEYHFAADASYVYIAFSEPSASLWRVNFTYGEVDELTLPGNFYIRKLVVSDDMLYVVGMNYTAHSVAVVKISPSAFAISEVVMLPYVNGMVYDMHVDESSWYLLSFNSSTEVSYLTKLDSSFTIVETVEIPVTGASKVVIGEDLIYIRGSNEVVTLSKDLVLSEVRTNIFGYGDLKLFNGEIYVAGYTSTGCPGIYVLAQNLTVIDIKSLSETSGTAFNIITVNNTLYVSAWETGVGTSVFKITDATVEKVTIQDTISSWPTDCLYFESEVPK